jgi:predicted phage terminase large subunit-like protein
MLAARESLAAFVEATSRLTLEPWQQLICARLERLRHETGQRLLIHKPPQFGGSIIVSQRWPAWMLGHLPDQRVRMACYNETHAEGFAGINLELMRSEEYRVAFAELDSQVPAICPAGRWYTAKRQRARDAQPSMLAMGLGSGFTGQGADLLIVDDPYKNRDEAFSDTIRERIWQWWLRVAKIRVPADANIVVMYHRWHLDDLAGRLMQEGGWENMTFPALADGDPDDPTERAPGEPLSPRYTVEWLEKLRDEDPSGFQALYQGKPVPDGGAVVKSCWWRYWYPAHLPEPPPVLAPNARGDLEPCLQIPLDVDAEGRPLGLDEIIQSWDMGFVKSDTSDFAVGLALGRRQADIFLLDEARERCDLTDAIALVRAMSARWPGSYAKYVEAKALGPRVIASLRNTIQGLIPLPADGEKLARLQAALPTIRGGNFYLPHPAISGWVNAFKGEVESFPAAPKDDRVDALSQGIAQLADHDWTSVLPTQAAVTPASVDAMDADEFERHMDALQRGR